MNILRAIRPVLATTGSSRRLVGPSCDRADSGFGFGWER